MLREDYNKYEDDLIKSIIGIRADYFKHKNEINNDLKDLLNSRLFYFKDEEQEKYEFVNEAVKNCIFKTIERIIIDLCVEKNIIATAHLKSENGKRMPITELFKDYYAKPLFAIVIKEKEPILYVFKNVGLNYIISSVYMNGVMQQIGIKEYHYVSMAEDKAYAEVLNHNEDVDDESRGTNIYNFKYFFISYFGENEYNEFKIFEERAVKRIKDILGYTIVKQLNPNGLFSFKKTFEKGIVNYPYSEKLKDSQLDDSIIEKVLAQYISGAHYSALLNEGSFSEVFDIEGVRFDESFITAEWLYQSMPNVGKIRC